MIECHCDQLGDKHHCIEHNERRFHKVNMEEPFVDRTDTVEKCSTFYDQIILNDCIIVNRMIWRLIK